MAITSMDQLISAIAERPVRPIFKTSGTTKGAGTLFSTWRVAGFPTIAPLPPINNGEIPTVASIGALEFSNAPVGKDLYLAKLGLQSSAAATWMVYDRLWHNSGMLGNIATAQTFTMPPLTRHSDGIGVEAFLEVYVALGATVATATIKYTNTDDVANRTGTTLFLQL